MGIPEENFNRRAQQAVIRFFAPVDQNSIRQLIQAVDAKLQQGTSDFLLLISSPGGTVFHGLTAYNYLKGIPASITTQNIGQVDSIGVILFCAGGKRVSVPEARFVLHGVATTFQNVTLEEPQLIERVKGLHIDTENIAKVIAANSGKPTQEVLQAMLDRTTLSPAEAMEWGLVHEIRQQLFEQATEVIAIDAA